MRSLPSIKAAFQESLARVEAASHAATASSSASIVMATLAPTEPLADANAAAAEEERKAASAARKAERQRLGTRKFVETIINRRIAYHSDIVRFFGANDSIAQRLLIADITSEPTFNVARKLTAFLGLTPQQTVSVMHTASKFSNATTNAGSSHIGIWRNADPSVDFIEQTLHTGNAAEAAAALNDVLDPQKVSQSSGVMESNGVLGCPPGHVAV